MSELFGNRQKQSLVILALIILAGVFVPMWNKRDNSPEAQVRQAVHRLMEGAEQGSLDPYKELLSQEVKDTQGRNREEILKTLFAIFFQYKDIKLTEVSMQVLSGTQADVLTVNLSLLMGARTPLPSDKGDFSLTFRREDDTWRVWQIDWEDGAQYAE